MKQFIGSGLLAIGLVTTGCASHEEALVEAEAVEVVEVVDASEVSETSESMVVEVVSSDEVAAAEGPERRVARPAIVSAEAWDSTPQPLGDDRLHEPKFVTIHHAGVTWKAGGDAATKVKNLQTWGQNEKDWPDLPYHFLIAPDGTIFEGRPTRYEPETNTNYEVHGHLGVQVYGNFEEQRISPAQMASLVQLTAWLLDEYQFETDVIGGHKDRKNADTTCPGKDLDRYIVDGTFVEWVDAARRGETPEIELGPALPGGPTEMIPDAG